MYNRNNVKSVSMYCPSIASGGSLIAPCFNALAACEITAVRMISGAATLATNWNLSAYKTASDAGSAIGTIGSSAAHSSWTGTSLTLTSTVALRRLAANTNLLYELVSQGGTTTNYRIEVDYIYGYTNA